MRAGVRSHAFQRRLDRRLHGVPLHGGRRGVRTIAGAGSSCLHPALSRESGHRQLPLARQAVRGWRRLVPPASRLAWPEEILLLVCLEMLNLLPDDFGGKRRRMGIVLASLLTISCYWRPGETLKILVGRSGGPRPVRQLCPIARETHGGPISLGTVVRLRARDVDASGKIGFTKIEDQQTLGLVCPLALRRKQRQFPGQEKSVGNQTKRQMFQRCKRQEVREGEKDDRAVSSVRSRHITPSNGRGNESTPSARQLLVNIPTKTLSFIFAVKIFAGTARFSRALALLGFAVVPWDLTKGP